MRVRVQVAFLSLCAALALTASPAEAHHGWSAYDAAKVIKVEAPIAAVRYRAGGEERNKHRSLTHSIPPLAKP
jgi:hypothetical protein